MSRVECVGYYHQALREGQKYYNECAAAGRHPFPQVLDDLLEDMMSAAHVSLGTMEIPMEKITGTLAAGRKSAFAGNFMPLLDENSEFAAKWISLCDAHLNEGGITDPIKCYEYMWHYYVQEGHKRVSVLRFFDAPTVRAEVERIVPPWSDDPEIRAYYDYIQFSKLSGVNLVEFHKPGRYARLQAALGMKPDQEWTDEDRQAFSMLWIRVQGACDQRLLSDVGDDILISEVLLACLEMYPAEEIKSLNTAELRKRITAMLPDLRFIARDKPTEVSTSVPQAPAKGVIGQLLDGLTRSTLNIAFVHAADPELSEWSRGHDKGRQYLEEKMGSQIRVRSYFTGNMPALDTMELAVKEGAQVIFATAAPLLEAARLTAAAHPGVKVLVCALSVPYAGVRTYYSRNYEARFAIGALAGALCQGRPVGYLARYPIMGTPAAVNAFALGVRMTAPDAKVILDWTCVPGNPVTRLWNAGVRIISGHETIAHEPLAHREDWSMVRLVENSRPDALATVNWNWGRMYEQIVRSILGGAWDVVDPEHDSAVSYWWGMNTGAINVRLANGLPEGCAQLTRILSEGLREGRIDPFACTLVDQQGTLRGEALRPPKPEELMHMDWFLENVVGKLPAWEELLPMSRETTRLLGFRGEEAPAGKETPRT